MVSEKDLVDVGYGKPIKLSSVWGDSENIYQLLPVGNVWTPDYSFHTDHEEMPHVIVDLLSSRSIRRLRIFNRESHPERAIPLSISISSDGFDWLEISQLNYVFGGRKHGEPLDLVFHRPVITQYLKFQVLKDTFFHLDYIEILAGIPVTRLGSLQKIDATGRFIVAEYYHHYSYGFTWTFTATLTEIVNCCSHGVMISRINYSFCLMPFKSRPETDVYPILFRAKPPTFEVFERLAPVNFHHHGVYSSYDLNMLNMYAELYFAPSPEVLSFEEEITRSYGFQSENTIALVFRGTDKSWEVAPTPVERYIEVALAVLRARPEMRVIIQTDQQQALTAVVDAIPNAIVFKELPVTSGTKVIHRLSLEDEFKISKPQFAIRMLAVTHLLSRCRFVVTHTGNIGFWLACYRGSSEGFYQFDSETNLRGSAGNIIDDLAHLEIQRP